MNFTIITHVIHGKKENEYFGYGPYIREMNLWLKHVDEVTVVAPFQSVGKDSIHLFYEHGNLHFKSIAAFSFTSVKNSVKALVGLPWIFLELFRAMKSADHIHLRCPGNIGLLGCLVQILFPGKTKTAKYAGNWDPNAKQPLSYRLQKWILSNTFLTRNMQVMVYGEWEGSTKNIKPFFTASYGEKEEEEREKEEGIRDKREETRDERQETRDGIRDKGRGRGNLLPDPNDSSAQDAIRFLFVGTLSEGKRPLYAIRLVETLRKKGYTVFLDLYGEGSERKALEAYICSTHLDTCIVLQGNQTAETIKAAYQHSHFLVLPSKSEGWPKVVAEAMFWGCVPVASAVSCVPSMLNKGNRGVLLTMSIEEDVQQLERCILNKEACQAMAAEGMAWSRKYTLDYFEEEIRGLLGGSSQWSEGRRQIAEGREQILRRNDRDSSASSA